MTQRELKLLEKFEDPERQKHLESLETAEAVALLNYLHVPLQQPEALVTAKQFLKRQWRAGWRAAGGPDGLRVQAAKAGRP